MRSGRENGWEKKGGNKVNQSVLNWCSIFQGVLWEVVWCVLPGTPDQVPQLEPLLPAHVITGTGLLPGLASGFQKLNKVSRGTGHRSLQLEATEDTWR